MQPQICIITGSTLGSAEYVGDHLSEILQQQGYATRVENHAELADVLNDKIWLIVTSTHGAGELPDNLRPFIWQIAQEKTDLSHLKFAVVGLGNSDYDTFCFAVDEVEKTLLKQGAQQVCPSLRIDVLTEFDHDQCAEEWLPNFTSQL